MRTQNKKLGRARSLLLRIVGVFTASVLTGSMALPATGAPLPQDLRVISQTKIVGPAPDAALTIPAALGDVNGDGFEDVGMAGSGSRSLAGLVHVLFGPFPEGRVVLGSQPESGFTITGGSSEDLASFLRSVGDVNNDGYDDVLLGAPFADNNERANSGSVYVIFGGADPTNVDLASFDQGLQGERGFRIDGSGVLTLAGISLDGIGDMNGDGLDDIIVEAEFADAAYVVYGKTDTLPVDLLSFDLGSAAGRGFYIEHPSVGYSSRVHVAGIGDANGDSIPDVALTHYKRGVGNAHVIFGARNSRSLDVTELGDRGFYFQGDAFVAVEGAGDVNGDGLDDLLLGVPQGNKAYLLFGRDDTETLFVRQDMRPYAIRIWWGNFTDRGRFGNELAGGEDLNGDGLLDIVVGARAADPFGRKDAGAAYVFFGPFNRNVAVGRLPSRRGIKFIGEHSRDLAGYVAVSPDLDGDGKPDLLIGSDGYRAERAGKVHILRMQ